MINRYREKLNGFSSVSQWREGTSFHHQQHILADVHEQVEIIEHGQTNNFTLVPFQQKLETIGLFPLKPSAIEIFQVNIGKMCNQTCKHCHVDAGPDRKEIMTKETMQLCLDVLKKNPPLPLLILPAAHRS